MTPDAVMEAAELLKAVKELRALLVVSEEKKGQGEISLVEDVSESGCGTRAYVYLPEYVVRGAARMILGELKSRLEMLGVVVVEPDCSGDV